MFGIVRGLEELGTAKLLEVVGNESVVEYFDSPANDGRSTRVVKTSALARRSLGANTRVYYQELNDARWLVGRVLESSDREAFVRFSNRDDRWIDHARLFVRWNKPIADPCVFLSHVITETPQYAYARSEFLKSYIEQRSACGGISALLSSAIELEAHQIDVVRRVLNDISQRHLLADEVGLGKTIEAGVIIRQAALDDPKSHRIVIVAPTGLTHQWRAELTEKFGLGDFIDDSIAIYSMDEIGSSQTLLSDATMLVIDEAHHLTSITDSAAIRAYAAVAREAGKVGRLLLLSATPALRNEVGFLRMLHLLDPAVYGLDDEQAFRRRLLYRQSLAEAVAYLHPQNALSLEPVLDELAQKLPTDTHLLRLIAALKAELNRFPEAEDPQLDAAIVELRAHLSETYRLHRRILRNRRKSLRFITPERHGCDCAVVPGWKAAQVESLLEDWRLNAIAHSVDSQAAAEELSQVYFGMVRAILEDPRTLGPYCDGRIRQVRAGKSGTTFPAEIPLMARIVDSLAGSNWLQSRLDALDEVIGKHIARGAKVVVFCADESTADLVYAHLSKTHKASVVRHSTEEGTATKWRSFQNKQETSAIVCGPNAEEGLNLQGGAKAVVHFDLPMEPGRVEQRMGRVDRYGSGSAIHSTVLVDDGSILQMSWYQLLAKGLGVFSQSIASLQYFIEEEMRSLRRGLFDNGSERFENLLADFSGPSGKVSQELRLIDQQDSLDELSSLPDSQSSLIEDVDSDWKSISGAVGRWVVDTLLFEKVIEGIKPERKSPEPPYRFRYHKPRGAGAATLLPLSALLEDFIGALDLDAPESSSSQPLTYRYTAHRKTAVSWGARVLRYGDAFVEAVKSFTTTDDRGRCFGIWRQHPGGPEAGVSMYFRFDFVVQIALDDAQATLRNSGFVVSDAAYAAIRRRGDALFAPTATRIWVTEDGELVDKRLIEQCLDLPYSKEPGAAEYTDTNLQSARIHTLIENRLELFASWPDRCANARDRAHHHVLQDEYFLARQAEALDAAIRKNSLRNAQLSARVSTLEGVEAEIELAALALETALGAALREGIATPSVRLDVMGFVVLSRGIPPLDAANRGTTT